MTPYMLALTHSTGSTPDSQAADALKLLHQAEHSLDHQRRQSNKLPLSLQMRCHGMTKHPAYRHVRLAEALSRPGHSTRHQFHLAWAKAYAALGADHLSTLHSNLARTCS